ncbi:uncharacterized protein [Antedon mediterranea]|uniref:uncharacterized protein n=1 Tax=Antedon mediterranea TaxID=105859 RepID=UPI003AF92AA2
MVAISYVLFLSAVIGVLCKEDAVLKMEYSDDNGKAIHKPLELYGNFSPAGPKKAAEGNLLQLHPASFCNVDDMDDLKNTVVVMKLESPEHMPCVAISLYVKAKRAIKMGAVAIIFIITENLDASKKLEKDAAAKKLLDQPIIMVDGKQGQSVMKLVQSQVAARAKLEYNDDLHPPTVITPRSDKPVQVMDTTNQFFNMSIFVAVFVLFAIVCLLVLLKFMWRQRSRQTTTTQLTQNTLSQMKVRKYKRIDQHRGQYEGGRRSVSTLSDGVLCAICLEDFKDGEDIRVVPCGHEFHRRCVDPWLLSNKTCPLCMYNIMEFSTEAHLCMPNAVTTHPFDHNYVQSVRLSAALQRRQNLYSAVAPSGVDQRQSWPGYARRNGQAGSPSRRNRHAEQTTMQNVDETRTSNLCHRCENRKAAMRRSRNKHSTFRQGNDRQFVQLPKISSSQSFLQYEALATQLPTGPQYVHPRDQIVHDYLYFYEDCPSDLRETTSLSSLTPSAFHADWEVSDSSRNSGNWDNFDSNQSIYGSCISLRSDPTPPDPHVYSRPESLPPLQAFENSVQLLPKCVHRTRQYNSKKVDSDESKNSGQSKMTNGSMKVNLSQEGNDRSQHRIAAEQKFAAAATEYEPCLKCAYRRIKRLHEEYTGLSRHSTTHFHRRRYKKTHRSPDKVCTQRAVPYSGHLTKMNCRRKNSPRSKNASKRVHRPGRSHPSTKKSAVDDLPAEESNIVQSVAVCEGERGKVQMLPVHRGTRHLLEALV